MWLLNSALFMLFVASGCYSSGVAIYELLEQYLDVACQRERINVQLTFNRLKHPEMTKSIREMIWRGRICIGDDKSGACCSQLNMIQDYHVVLVGYSKCGIEKTFFAGGFNFIAKVHFWGVGNVNEQFEIQCAVPFVESHVKAKMIASRKPIRISSVDFTNNHHSSSSSVNAKPISVRLGDNLYVAIEPTLEGMQKRLHTYPLRCWLTVPSFTSPTITTTTTTTTTAADATFVNTSTTDTTISSTATASDKQFMNSVELSRYFIEDGCPSVDDNDSLLAFLEQKTGTDRYAEWTKIKIPLTHNLVSTSLLNESVVVNKSVEYGLISLHCDVIFCTGHKLNGFQDTPTCPRSSFCSPTAGERRHFPSWIEPHLQRSITVTLNSPIRILLANASEPTLLDDDELSNSDDLIAESDDNLVNVAYDSKCARVCAVAVEEALRKEEECRLDGIPLYAVIIIAIISFAFGIAFVATLWLIHNKTDPLRKIRCADRNRRGMPLNAIYRDSVIRPLNNANAFMITCSAGIAERERLVTDRPQ
uniref:ZP domain-containing protein n=1 Tax=Setaria digitata TaxID=48799 RepID=A0A915PLA9_9BILA